MTNDLLHPIHRNLNLQKLAGDDKYDNVVFLKIDVDEVGVSIKSIVYILGFARRNKHV